jgi:hypothetical protein
MKLLAVVDGEWAARAVAQLHEAAAGVVAVAVAEDGARHWRGHAAAAALPQLTAVQEDAVDQLLMVGAGEPPPPLSQLPRFVVTAVAGDGRDTTDPVQWAIRTGQERLEVRLQHTDGPQAPLHRIATRTVDLAGLGYTAAAGAVVAVAVALLAEATEATEAAEPAGGEPVEPADAFPVDRLALRVDWAASAPEVVRLVRSGAGRATGAWSYLAGFPVTISAARVVLDTAGRDLPPGTIVGRDGDRLVVQTGSGLVSVAGVRDSVGALPATLLRLGLRFGVDAEEALRELSLRICDLERTVDWLVRRLHAGAL